MTADTRRQAEARGRRAETLAALTLQLKGYTIIARRVRLPVGEIDLIARRGRVLAFIEVKQRASIDRALTAVPQSAWNRIARAAESWTARRSDLSGLDWRYDMIAIAPWRWPVHKRDFWRP